MKAFYRIFAMSIAIITCLSISGCISRPNAPDYALYIFGNELYYKNFDKNQKIKITGRLLGDDQSLNAFHNAYISVRTIPYNDGKSLLYPEDFVVDYGVTGRGISITSASSLSGKTDIQKGAEAFQIDTDIVACSICSDEKSLLYRRSDRSLYLYDLKRNEKRNIATDVSVFSASPKGKYVYYTKADKTLYVYDGNAEKAIDSGVESIYTGKTTNNLYYVSDGALYKYKPNGTKEIIASEVDNLIRINVDSDKCYYLKKVPGTDTEASEDEEDSGFTFTISFGGSDDDDDKDGEENKVDEAEEKKSIYELYLYNGKKEQKVLDDCSSSILASNGNGETIVIESGTDSSTAYFVINGTVVPFNKTAFSFIKFSKDGSKASYLSKEDNGLYQVSISEKAVSEPMLIDFNASNIQYDLDSKNLYYCIDGDSSDGEILKVFDGKTSNIVADEVYDYCFTSNGNIAVLREKADGTGDFYLYSKGKTTFVDYNVQEIIDFSYQREY